MTYNRRALFRAAMVVLLAIRPTSGQSIAPVAAGAATPTVSILTVSSGVEVRNLRANRASLDLGSVSYFQKRSAPGQSMRKYSKSFVISTRFALRVECPASSSSSRVSVTMSRLDGDTLPAIRIDGTTLGSSTQSLTQSMSCGSDGEHRLDVEIPIASPAGLLGSNIVFVATLSR
jgi:hypothetical protein